MLGPGDRVTPDMRRRSSADTRIEVAHAMAVTIALPEEDKSLFTFAQTVGELLAEANVTLGEGAVVVPALDTPVTAGLSVHIVACRRRTNIEREFIESGTVYETDP